MDVYMARMMVALPVLFTILLAIPSHAERKDIDLRDYDDELMRDLERTIKFFEPDITARNRQGAIEDATILQDGFKYTEDYFARKGNAEDAVEISRQGLQLIESAVKALEASDFDGASASARETARTCRSCHDIYKPLKK